MIATLTLNPAVDRAVYLKNLKVDAVNRADGSVTHAGGKGINVSRALTALGVPTRAFGLAGGRTGEQLRGLLSDEGIVHTLTETAAETRVNLKLNDTAAGRFTDINEAGGPVTEDELAALMDGLLGALSAGDVLVLSGSVPRGISSEVYRELILRCRGLGVRCLLDCDGEALRAGVRAAPMCIKPNREELEGLCGRRLPALSDIAEVCRELIAGGLGMVLVSLGGEGAVAVSADDALYAPALKVPVNSTVGAGDTFLAGFLASLHHGEPMERGLVRAVAASAAKVQLSGTAMPDRAAMERLIPEVRVSRL